MTAPTISTTVLVKIELNTERDIISLGFYENDTIKYFINTTPDAADGLAQAILKAVTPTPYKTSLTMKKADTGR